MDDIGSGQFGNVLLASDSTGQFVAVKTFNSGASQRDKSDFVNEAYLLDRLRHKNIVSLVSE